MRPRTATKPTDSKQAKNRQIRTPPSRRLRSADPEGRVLVQSAPAAGTPLRSDGPCRRVAQVAGEGHEAEVDRGGSVGAGRGAARSGAVAGVGRKAGGENVLGRSRRLAHPRAGQQL